MLEYGPRIVEPYYLSKYLAVWFMQQGIKFTEVFTQMAWVLLVL